jgi:UTP-glucose-1-phosphate uridylyltransferase
MEYYLTDTLNQLLDEALEMKNRINSEFDKGKLVGYYEIISKLLNQAESFGIVDKLPERVRDFNPESLLDKIW